MKTKTAVLNGKPDAGNPHVRFDEGEVASPKPRRRSLLYKGMTKALVLCAAMCGLSASAVQIAVLQSGTGRHTDEFDTAFAELGWEQAVFKKLIADINTVMPGLCNHNRRCFEDGPLHCMVTKGRNPLFLYVLNTGAETVEADFEVPEFRYVENVSLPLEKGGRLRITPGRFKATLAPGEIKVWRWQ